MRLRFFFKRMALRARQFYRHCDTKGYPRGLYSGQRPDSAAGVGWHLEQYIRGWGGDVITAAHAADLIIKLWRCAEWWAGQRDGCAQRVCHWCVTSDLHIIGLLIIVLNQIMCIETWIRVGFICGTEWSGAAGPTVFVMICDVGRDPEHGGGGG